MQSTAKVGLCFGIAALLLTSCASIDKGTALKCGAFALGGAAIGAAISGKKGAGRGALAGLAACAVVEIVSRQTRSKDEVEQDYRAANKGKLPAKAELVAYQTTLNPDATLKRGDALKVQSTIRVVAGTGEPIKDVKEVLIAYAPSGEEFKRGEKKANATDGSGEFVNTFTLKLPDGAPEGEYKIETQVLINGREVSSQPRSIQMVAIAAEHGYASL
ncbi:hypothetical protein HPT27_18005 [Permianibacter sp. IMCC34836]|uniref:hypothetical protein n=1 Tax=Permianibacter fluminis TaxID=2738515 RepID=UPI001557FFE9|nr:hypothetical protein [Permianibacter fluminis]NQD38915.1 hypothetical protein [Permianibacter fluminis]